MFTAKFDYFLLDELIAQHPTARRDDSRLLQIDRVKRKWTHRRFMDLPDCLQKGDLLVFNNSKVLHARLRARNTATEGRFEILLLEERGANDWWAMVRPGKRARLGTEMLLLGLGGGESDFRATVIEVNDEGHRRLKFLGNANILNALPRLGEVPLPPYIRRKPHADWREDQERYQTVYAMAPGSLAAPTAGLHFTNGLLDLLQARGIETASVTLHVGLGTFAPVKVDDITKHVMHEERFDVSGAAAEAIKKAQVSGRRIICVGTTTLRVLESLALAHGGRVPAGSGRTRIFIHPPHPFHVAGGLITNFHLPRSTLLMLVCAFAAPDSGHGREFILSAYAEAVRERYRFFSYGDAMFIS